MAGNAAPVVSDSCDYGCMTNHPHDTASPKSGFRASIRVQIFYSPDPRFKVEPELEVALTAEDVAFQFPPAKGDRFIPGGLGQALMSAGAPPIVEHVEHGPSLPFRDDTDDGYACVIVNCVSRQVPTSELVEELRREGWHVHDYRSSNGHSRAGDQ